MLPNANKLLLARDGNRDNGLQSQKAINPDKH